MQDSAQAWAFLEASERISGADEVQAAIRRVAGEIHGRLAESYPLVLVVMAGAVVFAGQLLPLLHFPLDLDFVHTSRYGKRTAGGTLEWRVAPAADVRGRTVLLLDDILDGGNTLMAIRERPEVEPVKVGLRTLASWRFEFVDSAPEPVGGVPCGTVTCRPTAGFVPVGK